LFQEVCGLLKRHQKPPLDLQDTFDVMRCMQEYLQSPLTNPNDAWIPELRVLLAQNLAKAHAVKRD
jgi:hypothetical protein